MDLIAQFSIGGGAKQIQYQSSVYRGTSPNEFTFFDGKSLWIGEVDDAKLFDIREKSFTQVVTYPQDHEENLGRGSYALFYSTHLILNSGYMVGYDVTKNPVLISTPTYYRQVLARSRPYAIRDYVFYYDRDGYVFAIDSRKNLLQNDATRDLLLEWQKTAWCRSEKERNMFVELLSSGEYIFIDGIFYPKDAKHLYTYFSKRGIDTSQMAFLNTDGYWPKGISMIGDIYFSDGAEGLKVISQSGDIQAIINTNSVTLARSDPRFAPDKPDFYNLSPTLYAIHPNGDIYTLYAIKDEVARMHRAARTWGTDYIGIAKSGIQMEEDAQKSMSDKLKAMSSIELRIIRNACTRRVIT